MKKVPEIFEYNFKRDKRKQSVEMMDVLFDIAYTETLGQVKIEVNKKFLMFQG